VDFLLTLNNNIAILYERNELWENENAYGVIKSLMEVLYGSDGGDFEV
jgi:hypothetical protein